jgi:hypothetical protein
MKIIPIVINVLQVLYLLSFIYISGTPPFYLFPIILFISILNYFAIFKFTNKKKKFLKIVNSIILIVIVLFSLFIKLLLVESINV